MAEKRGGWLPFTPGGSPLLKLASSSEASAWRNLFRNQKDLHYSGRTEFEKRGFSVKYDPDVIVQHSDEPAAFNQEEDDGT